MSKLSIYQTSWLNLVFENRNKEYGAYQLRQETVKTSFSALFIGLLFVSTIAVIPLIVNRFSSVIPIPEMPELPEIIHFKGQTIVQPQIPKPVTVVEKTTHTTTEKQLVDPIIVASNQPIDNIATNTNNSTPTTNATGTGTTTQPTTTPNTGAVTNITTPTTITGPATVDALDKKPEFPGGINKFYAFVGNNFEKPDLDSGQILKVYVSFVIEKDGSMTDIKVLKDPGFGLGKEAVRVLQSLKTKWTPGIIDKQAVRTAYSLPISIQID
jgi:periplasmic protein TonB